MKPENATPATPSPADGANTWTGSPVTPSVPSKPIPGQGNGKQKGTL
jgi:hypothetical protein